MQRKIAIGKAIAAGIFAIVTAQSSAYALDTLIATELLGRPTANSITLNVVTGYATDAYVKYGTNSGIYTDSTTAQSFADTSPVVILISGLTGNTKYYYRLCYRSSGSAAYTVRDELTFVTARTPGSTYCFTITADSHLYDKKGVPDIMDSTMVNMAKENPDFLLDLGDTYGDDHNPTTITKDTIWYNHLRLRPYFGQVCNSSAFYFCEGNHEGESGYWLAWEPPDNMAINCSLARKFYYNNPEPNNFYTGDTTVDQYGIGLPETYYAYTWGDALFVVLDVYRYYTANDKPTGWDWTLGQTQYEWFKTTLENSTAKYKFVFAHHVVGQERGGVTCHNIAEWGDTTNFEANRPGWGGVPIHELMVNNGVNVFFQGHDHLFSHEQIDGMVYQECPMAADSTYEIGMLANSTSYTQDTLKGTGHIRVTVGPEHSTVDYVLSCRAKDASSWNKNDSVAFSYTINAAPTAIRSNLDEGFSSAVKMLVKMTAQNLSFTAPERGLYSISIYKPNGVLVQSFRSEAIAGENTIHLTNRLASACYLVRIKGAGVNTSFSKMVF